MGIAYVFKSGNDFKIGCSTRNDAKHRLRAIQTSQPNQVILVREWQTKDPYALESTLHKAFADMRMRGEWFSLTDADLKRCDDIAAEFAEATAPVKGYVPKPKDKLYLRYRTAEGKQSAYCRAAYDAKSRLRPNWCLVDGLPEHHPGAYYYQRLKRDGKWVWESRGNDPHAADIQAGTLTVAQKRMERLQTDEPKPTPVKSEPATDVHKLSDEVQTYLGNVSKLAPKTYHAYKLSLEQFQQSCSKIYVHQIGKQDLQKFDSDMLKEGFEDRTRHNRVEHVTTFLRNKEGRRLGAPITNVMIKIKYVERPPEAYTRQELENLFAASTNEEQDLWRFLLGTGFREQEVSVAEVTDLNPDTGEIRVDEKPYFGFKPKDCEKRLVPLKDDLIRWIAAHKVNGTALLFPHAGKPDGHLLRKLKIVAFRGGLNCGKCVGTHNSKEISCADAPCCEKWILHRFRKNFATNAHAAGAGMPDIQLWLGHSDIKTTMRYMAASSNTSAATRAIVNRMHAGL